MPADKATQTGLELPDSVRDWFSSDRTGKQIPPLAVREWLGQVLRQNYRLFYSIAYGYFANPAYAEDVVQSAGLKAMQKLGQLKQPERVVAWFASITRNVGLDHLRNKMVNCSAPLDTASGLPSPGSFDDTRFDQQRLLLAAIDDLPENQGIVVRLRFIEDCDISEIAKRLGLRDNTVEVRLHRALKGLRNHPSLGVLARDWQ